MRWRCGNALAANACNGPCELAEARFSKRKEPTSRGSSPRTAFATILRMRRNGHRARHMLHRQMQKPWPKLHPILQAS